MIIAEKKLALSVAKFLLDATAENDIRAAHQPGANLARPRLPENLDSFYTELVELVEREGSIRDAAPSPGLRLRPAAPERPRQRRR